MELTTAMLSRRSHRSYTSEQITEEQLQEILAAGCVAPLGRPSEGKPHLTVVQDKALLAQLGGLFGPEHDILYGAPTLILISCRDLPSANLAGDTAGCVAENMCLAATQLGLGSIVLYGCTVGINASEELRKTLSVPENYTATLAVAVGHSTEPVEVCKEMSVSFTVSRA